MSWGGGKEMRCSDDVIFSGFWGGKGGGVNLFFFLLFLFLSR